MSSVVGPLIQHRVTSIKPTTEVHDAVVTARVAMIMSAPFFGNLVLGMETVFVPDDDAMFRTLATDGRRLFINGGFFMTLTADERVFVLGHELGHVIYDHAGANSRRGDRNPQGWNIAADYVDNYTMVKSRIGGISAGSSNTLKLSNGMQLYYDTKYDEEWSVEMVYADLKQKAKKAGGQSKDKQVSQGSADQQQGGGPDDGLDFNQGGKRVLDEHMETGASNEVGFDNDGNMVYEIYAEGQVPAEEANATQQQARSQVMSAAKAVAASKSASSVPAGVLRQIEQWTESKIDWRELLAITTTELFSEDFTYVRPSKKSWSTNVIIPGHSVGEEVRIAAGLDQSGSIGQEEAAMFLGELWGIMQMFDNYVIDVWCYDTAVYNHQTFTPENVDDLKTYQVQGGGGTDYDCNYAFMKKHEIMPNQFVNFTDGWPCSSWGDPDYCETVFIITDKSKKPPFGKYAHFED